MSALVVNHLHLNTAVEDVVRLVEEHFAPAFQAQPGFEAFHLVKVGEQDCLAVIVWADVDAAAAAAAVIGPSVFTPHLTPLVDSQERWVGPAVATVRPAAS
jgi:hypothetical protein